MTLLSKIRLSGKFGKPVYVVSALVTLVMAGFTVFDPLLLPECLLLKLASIPFIFYLISVSGQRQKMYFYLNLGISRNEFRIIPYAVDLVVFIVLIIISVMIGNAIS